MKSKEEHVYGESFSRTMKLVAKDMIQWPLIAEDVRDILYHGRELIIEAIIGPTIRLLALILFPIAVPVVAILWRREMERTETSRKTFTQRWMADRQKLVQKLVEEA